MIIEIDASNIGSGGGINHLKFLIEELLNEKIKIQNSKNSENTFSKINNDNWSNTLLSLYNL